MIQQNVEAGDAKFGRQVQHRLLVNVHILKMK